MRHSHRGYLCGAKTIFGGKLGNPSFSHIVGMETPKKFFEKRQVLVSPRI